MLEWDSMVLDIPEAAKAVTVRQIQDVIGKILPQE